VQVRAGDAAGGADRAEQISPFFDRLTGTHVDARQVHVGADQALAVVDENRVAVEEIVAGIGHHPIGRRLDRRPGAGRHIQPGMRVARLAVEDAAQAEA
jgi:hypothetical protein